MTQQIINIGAAPNDGTGDQLRSSFDKCNLNFTELYLGVAKGVSIGSAIEYQFNTTTTEPPASGQIRFNQATQASTTKLWASHTTSSGINIKQFLSAATTGAKLILQDENDNTNYIKFDVTGVPVDKTTYWEFAVVVTASGGNLPNAAILAAVTAAAGGGGTSDPTPPQGRLTLQTGVPVMISTQAAKTAIYYTPYNGNKVPLYDGTNMVMTTFAELTVATTDTTKSPAAIGANKVNDWFVWNDAGTPRLSHGPDWTNDTTRSAGTVLMSTLGIWTNGQSITNGPAAQRGTYVGTTRSNASSTLDWIYGTIGAPPTAAVLGVWNAYNRVRVETVLGDSTGTWTYALTTIREIRGDTTAVVNYVCGLAEDNFTGFHSASSQASTNGFAIIGVGYDATNAFSGVVGTGASAAIFGTANGFFSALSLGYHFMAALEVVNSANTMTFFGSGAFTGAQTEGLKFEGRF